MLQTVEDDGLESLGAPTMAESAESVGAASEEIEALANVERKLRSGESFTDDEHFVLEAIIFPDKRPVIDVIRDGYEPPTGAEWGELSDTANRERLQRAMQAIGRVELLESSGPPYLGTGFMVAPNLLLTNRHVADDFVAGLGESLRFIAGLDPVVDYERWVEPSDGFELKIVRPLLIHPWWDAALLEVEGFPADRQPLRLCAEQPSAIEQRLVAAVGYPAFDPRNNADVQNRVFRGIYNVKRLQPGRVLRAAVDIRSFGNTVEALSHDCSTLGGNSGSALLDVATGHVLGLHFGGRYLDANFAVPSWELAFDPRVRDLGVRLEGTPKSARSWLSAWNDVPTGPTERPPTDRPPSVPSGTGAKKSDDESAWSWFERCDDGTIARAYAEDAEGTRARLEQVLPHDEVADLVADLQSEIGAAEESLEGWFSRKPDPELPEIVFLHGIMGGHLAHQGFSRNRIWLDPLELLRGNLAERLTLGDDGFSDHGDLRIEPDGHIQLKYRKPARKWRKAGFIVHPFSFDWRRGVRAAAEQLHLFIEQRWATRRRRVVLVGHSMGGLVISTYSTHHSAWSDRVERVVLIGSPLGGSYAVPLTVLGHNKTIRKLARLARCDSAVEFQEMAATLPGLIDMLPNAELFPEAADFYGQPGWPGVIRPRQSWLTQSASIKRPLRSSPMLDRCTLLVSLGHGTVDSMPWHGAERLPGPRTGIGDGTVPAASALVEGLSAYKVDREHGDMPNDPKAIQGVIELIREGRATLDPVQPADLEGRLPLEAVLEAVEEADLEERRARFEQGRLGLDDLRWLGEI